MTSDEFKMESCKENKLTEEEFDQRFVVVPCDCECPQCEGWAVVLNKSEDMNIH